MVIAVLLLGAGAFLAGRAVDNRDESFSSEPVTERSAPTVTDAPRESAPPIPEGEEPVAAAAAIVSPAVVQIETDDGLGSGVIYDKQGHILTAAHVVGNARSRVIVRQADGTTTDGRVLGAEPRADVAVVQIPGSPDLPLGELALGVQIQVGQMAVAVGSPFGLDQTVTAGIVSAIDRAVPVLEGAVSMLQTDAPINPGNSGGALADRRGRVIGINDAIRSDSGSNVGVGFAIPIDIAKSIADRIVSGEPIEYAFLGVQSAPVQGSRTGALIVQVVSDSPAAEAGLRRGDRLTAIDGSPVRSPIDLVALVRAHQPGDRVSLTFERDGRERTVEVSLAKQE